MADDGKRVMAGALDGVRVLDFTSVMAGPFATRMLADLGAEVIKVESLEGDQVRARPPKRDGHSAYFGNLNAGKQSIACNLKSPEIIALMKQLVATCDVLVENFRPGVMARFGLDFATLAAINPRLIYCAISGFGTSGPARDRPTYDTVAQAASGFLRLLTPPEKPRVIGPALADAVTGHYAATGILAALIERGQTGKGRRLDISMLEAMSHFNLDSFTHYFSEGEVMGPLSRPVVSQSYTFQCADGKWIAFHLSSPPKFWEGLLEATGQQGLAKDPRFAERLKRIAHQDDLIEILTPVFKSATRDEWCTRLEAAEVPYAPAYDSNEALEDPPARRPHLAVTVPHPTRGEFTTVRAPYSFDGEAELDVTPPPMLDQHGAEIRAEMARRRTG